MTKEKEKEKASAMIFYSSSGITIKNSQIR
jgi:hypothetical protein